MHFFSKDRNAEDSAEDCGIEKQPAYRLSFVSIISFSRAFPVWFDFQTGDLLQAVRIFPCMSLGGHA